MSWLPVFFAVASSLHGDPGQVGKPGSPIVVVVGCASETAQPQVWALSRVGERTESPTAAIAPSERDSLAARPLGTARYELIGVADFVAPELSRNIGARDQILTTPRVNATGMLANGHKVAAKGLFIDARPPRINVVSVIDLAARCP